MGVDSARLEAWPSKYLFSHGPSSGKASKPYRTEVSIPEQVLVDKWQSPAWNLTDPASSSSCWIVDRYNLLLHTVFIG